MNQYSCRKEEKTHSFKAQFWSFDVIFAIVIFSFAITIIAVAWYGINSSLALATGSGSTLLQSQAELVAQALLSPGSPYNWQTTIATNNILTWSNASIGLGQTYNNDSLSGAKLYALAAMSNYNYGATKPLLGVSYDYYIIIAGQTINVTIGRKPSSNNAVTIGVEKRQATLQGIPVKMTVEIWTNTSLGVA